MNSALSFTQDELRLLADAMDSHIYWQIAGEDPNQLNARQNGIVYDLRIEDPEVRERLAAARQLQAKIEVARQEMGG